ncbi:MAG: BamA/TamA family outer membrane protein [Synergistaceae bacterium]|nr:BamA/TamA family outer membrane protein [Synergistaceae bacterium]MDD3319719.1 POTRA domain-containing protein [Synergistaceae bacterium]
MSFHARFFSVLVLVFLFILTPAYAAEENLTSPDIQETTADNGTEKLQEEQKIQALTGPVILDISVQGNVEVVTEHIMSIITSKVGEPVDEEKLRKDAEAIFELGFFVATDYRVTDKADGVDVVFLVQENPVVSKINFEGNTIYSSEKLEEMIFTKPGMIFNRTFFRNDLQRIKEKYQADGYVMANVADVRIEGTEINVVIVEPKISQIVIQGNKITKTHVVRRYLKIKEGELFNANKLRLSLSRLQGVGFFSDVNVNFEPDEDPNDVIVVLTVEEGRTGKLGFNIAYGTQSGFGGGLSYENTNIGGRGMKLSVGFDLGNREEYWLSYEQPYMSGKVTAWKVGGYKRAWTDLRYYVDDQERFRYDRDKTGAFLGFGRKFKDESLYNWYLLFDWHEVTNEPDNPTPEYEKSNWGNKDIDKKVPPTTILDDLGDGTYYSVTASVRRLNIDEYLPYSKGDVQTLNVQYGQADVAGVDYSYFKYWLEAKFYFTVDKLFKDFFETSFGGNTDRPVIFASRIIVGSSSGDVPYEQMYTVGGDTTLRGYDDDRYHGEEMLLGNFELRVPMDKNFSLVAFYDIGRSWRKEGDTASFGSEMGSSPGFGVRINTPLGNLRLDYATGDEGRFHFGFGELF